MLILGLDPGSQRTGYGLIESRGGRLRAIAFGVIRPPRDTSFLERLPHLARQLEVLLERARPDAAAAEDIFLTRNSRVALKLGHVRGAALLPVLAAGIPVHEYAARLVKKTVTGFGGAEKEQVCRMVRLLLGLRDAIPTLDASDALAVAICHAHAGHAFARPPAARA
ncbi:MAG TPA: crossover junction endodeoxyribonuclease RuvC [Candidatus Polarisedimenticolia bacterium]|nr:crossover junction endodeoxyribonuclease RuvC [Candidatus Polarisedimenticolia bacterium]